MRGGKWRHEDFIAKWYGFENVITSVLLFLTLINIKYDKIPIIIKKVIAHISKISFGIYLVSFIFDSTFYPILKSNVPVITDQFAYYPIMVLIVFISSLILAEIIYFIKGILNRLTNLVLSKNQKSLIQF